MVSIVAVGVDKWEEYSLPFLQTLQDVEPEANVVMVDDASENPYKHDKVLRTDKRISYAAALNLGASVSNPDWYMFLNNDVYFEKPFLHRFDDLDPKKLHGMNTYQFKRYEYICGWCMIVSREIWECVGKFDEALVPMWFEDADYSIRCQRDGFPLQVHDRYEWGVIHIEDENMSIRRNFMHKNGQARRHNRAYVERKHRL